MHCEIILKNSSVNNKTSNDSENFGDFIPLPAVSAASEVEFGSPHIPFSYATCIPSSCSKEELQVIIVIYFDLIIQF